MTNIEIAIDILRASADGNRLEPSDLYLVECGVNGRLTERGEVALAALRVQVLDGSYFDIHRWFHGIEQMTRDHEGYIYWKGAQIEHFSYHDDARELAAAMLLAEHCRHLDAIGIPVNSRTAISADCYTATAETPWKLALRSYYSFFEKGEDFAAIFYSQTPPAKNEDRAVFIVERSMGDIRFTTVTNGAYAAFHYLQDRGYISVKAGSSFEETVRCFERIGVSAERLDAEILGTTFN